MLDISKNGDISFGDVDDDDRAETDVVRFSEPLVGLGCRAIYPAIAEQTSIQEIQARKQAQASTYSEIDWLAYTLSAGA
jgi:hypothetical protein